MNSTTHLNLEEAILSTNAEPLAAINIGILDKAGNIQEVITFEELARVGNSQSLNMHNWARFGHVECQFTISNEDNLRAKVAYLRDQLKDPRIND